MATATSPAPTAIAAERELMNSIIEQARQLAQRPGNVDLQRKVGWALQRLDQHRRRYPRLRESRVLEALQETSAGSVCWRSNERVVRGK
jgi:hypothetical protein